MSPLLVRRVALLGSVALLRFAMLFFRLWFLQVLLGEDYVSQAAQNTVRKVRIGAPRGDIVDRKGRVLVTTRRAAGVQIRPGGLPRPELDVAAAYGRRLSAAERARRASGSAHSEPIPVPPIPGDHSVRSLFRRLGRVIDLTPRQIHERVVRQLALTPYAAVTVKTDIGRAAASYLAERPDRFPAVQPAVEYLRTCDDAVRCPVREVEPRQGRTLQLTLDRLRSQGSGNPLLDRAIEGAYPTGFFYRVGHELYSKPGQILQTWARRFGFGRTTGVDLPGEFGGLVPDRRWRDAGYAETQRCVRRHHLALTDPSAPYRCYPFIDRPYSPGDNVNLAVGQGDLQATPLQLATAYSALANGGTLVTPHLGRAIEDGRDAVERTFSPAPRGTVGFGRATRRLILAGLRGATSSPEGTSADVFAGFPYAVYGKTGTAEHLGQPDQSWYAGFVDDPTRPIVVAVTIEKGGFGAATAAPVARLILASWFHLHDTTFHSGESTTR